MRRSIEALGDGERLIWYPAETDVSIRPGWFYHGSQDDKVKSVEHLLDIYFSSVGYNSVLLLNLPPDRRGLIHENDVRRLREFRKVLDAIFDENLAAGAKATASNVKGNNPAFLAGKITDGDPDTYWTTDGGTTAATVEFDLGKTCTFNVAELAEHIEIGQRVAEFALDGVCPRHPGQRHVERVRPGHDGRLQAAAPLRQGRDTAPPPANP